MRLRNVKHAKELIETHPEIIILNPTDLKGNWSKEFGNNNPIHIEIGCGKGRFIAISAKENPNINFIGIEKFDSVIVRAIEKLIKSPQKNVRLLRIDAENITDLFAKAEINEIYLNFSDPWPKRRHEKKRLTSNRFLNRYRQIIVNHGKIKFKSDNYGLFEYSMMSFNNHQNYLLKEVNIDLYRNQIKNNIQTEFEKKFVDLGNRIYYLQVEFTGE